MRRAIMLVPSFALALSFAGVGACAGARRSEPFAPELQLSTAEEVRGEIVFAQQCAQCHPNGEAGLGPAINDRPVPRALIATQIRLGVGAMPAFDEDTLSDDDVDAVTAYLVALRRSPRSK